MPWLQVHLEINANNAELVEQTLLDCGAVSVTLQDRADQPILEPGVGETPLWASVRATGLFANDAFTNDPLYTQLGEQLTQQLNLPTCALSFEQLEDKDWEREWLSHFKPMRCGNQLWICPGWERPPEPNAINLLLDPGLAFGTGTHETTMLCLEWLSQQTLNNQTVIDFGCGSGILGIATLLLNAKHVLFVDNDPQALAATQANLEKNHIASERYTLEHANQYHSRHSSKNTEDSPAAVDLLIANILATPLIELSETFLSALHSDGQIVLSGILAEQAKQVMAAYLPAIQFTEPEQRNDWVRLAGIRS